MKGISNIKETLRIKIRKKYIKITAKIRNKKIKNSKFTIISNNCWGGIIYQSYGLKYTSPTIGLFFMADDYIKFISNLKRYMDSEIEFIDSKCSKWYEVLKNKKKFGKYPIGKIDDIEIHFLHYKGNKEAREKWERRKRRINWNCIIYKYSQMNNCTEENIKQFQKLNFKNKICFICQENKKLENEYTFAIKKQRGEIQSSYEPFGKSKYINLNNYINSLERKDNE